MKHNNTIICLMGPTASGKTQLAIELVRRLPCDIVSVDSGMVYRGMDIGTAKPTPEEQAEAPHRLIDIRDPWEPYSAAAFRADALREIETILGAGRIPLLVGGTMLYFRALQEGLTDLPSADPEIRVRLQQELDEAGLAALHARLATIDPDSAARIKPTDPQRTLRALEVCESTGRPMSDLLDEQPGDAPPYTFLNMAVALADRQALHDRIARRFDQMLGSGLVDEVKKLIESNKLNDKLPAMRAVGYRQVGQYLNGEFDHDTLRTKAIVATRQLAKRQLTWLRHWPSDLTWLDSQEDHLLQRVLQNVGAQHVAPE